MVELHVKIKENKSYLKKVVSEMCLSKSKENTGEECIDRKWSLYFFLLFFFLYLLFPLY